MGYFVLFARYNPPSVEQVSAIVGFQSYLCLESALVTIWRLFSVDANVLMSREVGKTTFYAVVSK